MFCSVFLMYIFFLSHWVHKTLDGVNILQYWGGGYPAVGLHLIQGGVVNTPSFFIWIKWVSWDRPFGLFALCDYSCYTSYSPKVRQTMRDKGIERDQAMDLVRLQRLMDVCDSKESTALYLLEEWNYEPQVSKKIMLLFCYALRVWGESKILFFLDHFLQ